MLFPTLPPAALNSRATAALHLPQGQVHLSRSQLHIDSSSLRWTRRLSARSIGRGGVPYVLNSKRQGAQLAHAPSLLCSSFFALLSPSLFPSLSHSLTCGTHAACLYDKWQCDDGTCIAKDLLCNGNIDCPEDISDERYCDGECATLCVWVCARESLALRECVWP